jgi:hypothetical protein
VLHPGVVFKKNKKILKPRGETGGIQISMVMACLVTEVVTEKKIVLAMEVVMAKVGMVLVTAIAMVRFAVMTINEQATSPSPSPT